ncbi:IclR family transcriptional regulator [Sphingomonas sp.]|jgi:DNA-binding IclR family transcriptional regulator|uniref:IclR family transcriptional regulator n=1 Tax=Sphingomonas sp. TaxID=28214 RepID=UPI002ED9B685
MSELPRYSAPALKKGLEVLELLSSVAEPMAMAEIAAQVGRSKGEIFRMIQVLEEEGYIARGGEGYLLTNRLFELGMQRPPIRDLVQSALPQMEKLAERAGQSCHLAIASRAQMVVVARVEAPGYLGFAVRVGHRRPLAITVSGLTLLAFQDDATRVSMLETVEKEGVPFDRAAVIEWTDQARARGFIRQQSRMTPAVTDLSAPILLRGNARAALTMPYLKGSAVALDEQEAVTALLETAATISSIIEFGDPAGGAPARD